MKISIPTEIKIQEKRVALIPKACAQLIQQGHQVYLQSGAGSRCGYSDEQYITYGVNICPDAESLYAVGELILKVKEPQPEEWHLLHSDHLLFCYLHLAAEAKLLHQLETIGLTAVGFETVIQHGRLPLLQPMSIIAGKLAVLAGSQLLQHHKGLLLGGLAATERGHVVVLGAGNAGFAATELAASMGAQVSVFDLNYQKLDQVRQLGHHVSSFYPYAEAIADKLKQADLVIGAVLVAGKKAPIVVTENMIKQMQGNSVVVDIAVDQGGCIATTHPTNYEHPSYKVDNVIHYAVTNMPAAVANTASQALSASLLPYVSRLASIDWREDNVLSSAINVENGESQLSFFA